MKALSCCFVMFITWRLMAHLRPSRIHQAHVQHLGDGAAEAKLYLIHFTRSSLITQDAAWSWTSFGYNCGTWEE